MKGFGTILIILLALLNAKAQERKIVVSKILELVQLSPETYVHMSQGSNGLVTVNNGEGVIVSTPPTDEATIQLINWVRDSLKVKITGIVIDSWHPDNMEGLDVFQTMHIKSYSNEMTRKIALAKGLPVPQIGFNQKNELKVGTKKIVLQYFGPAHTSDGIMVWLPDEKILFGSNAVRNYNGWVGNIGNANLDRWSETIEKVKAEFGTAKVVVPGHGIYGSAELLDYTIHLYKPSHWGTILKLHSVKPSPVFNDYGKVFVSAKSDTVTGSLHYLAGATVFVDKGDQYVMIESPSVKYDQDKKTISSDYGRLKILDKSSGSSQPETDGYYKGLTVQLRDDSVEITIVVKELMR